MYNFLNSLAVSKHDIETEHFRIFESSKRHVGWEENIEWGSAQTDSEILGAERAKFALNTAAQSVYAEQVGLVSAGDLLAQCEDFGLRLCLAGAVFDESRHVEVFSRYCLSIGKKVPPPSEQWKEITDELKREGGFIRQFFCHTMLENQAVEAFTILSDNFTGSLIGDIYKKVRTDEARHVYFGCEFLRTFADASRKNKEILSDVVDSSFDKIRIQESGSLFYAEHSERDASQIYDIFERKQKKMIEYILGNSNDLGERYEH